MLDNLSQSRKAHSTRPLARAHYLYEQVLNHLPTHLQEALLDDETKACQFSGLIEGLSDAAISQAEILNRMGNNVKLLSL